MCYLLLSQGRAVGGQTASQVLWQAAWRELHLGHFAIDSGKVARFAAQSSPRALAVDTAGTRVRLLGSPQLIAASSGLRRSRGAYMDRTNYCPRCRPATRAEGLPEALAELG
jgi:hypothetical protein